MFFYWFVNIGYFDILEGEKKSIILQIEIIVYTNEWYKIDLDI